MHSKRSAQDCFIYFLGIRKISKKTKTKIKRLQSLDGQRRLTAKPYTARITPHALCLTQLQDVVTLFHGNDMTKYLLMATILLLTLTYITLL
jgi:hypothetical protein